MHYRAGQISIDHFDLLVILHHAVVVGVIVGVIVGIVVDIVVGVVVGVVIGIVIGIVNVAIRFPLDSAFYISPTFLYADLVLIDMKLSPFIVGVVVAGTSFLVLFVISIVVRWYFFHPW
ncbi:hypothetical protein C2G38_2227166 [Gigaspora rosea]|uniref:Uncharacterized protein n=1 Tax=Gigaspora rosea TaxID=44941 RepID=A0A397TXB7_9GLOM|nr:hypothetical protein C2G38_2227166 [Gigaspora rosea]